MAAARPVRGAVRESAAAPGAGFLSPRKRLVEPLIAGDSLLVMNSLLIKESMGGKVQMIYIDPPYGIKYGRTSSPSPTSATSRTGRTLI